MDRAVKKRLEALTREAGATYSIVQTHGGHERVTLARGGISRFVVSSMRHGNTRAAKNFLGDVRRTLNQMETSNG